VRYRIVFEKIGRTGQPDPIDVYVDDDAAEETVADRITERVYDHVRPRLLSSTLGIGLDLETSSGQVLAGGYRPVGDFTITALQEVQAT
jgi:hypothetical protein